MGTEMNDLEMTKLCIDAIGPSANFVHDGKVLVGYCGEAGATIYDPLHDDAQAMALVKKFGLWLELNMTSWDQTYWHVTSSRMLSTIYHTEHKDDLNRAIVECVVKMQEANHEKAR